MYINMMKMNEIDKLKKQIEDIEKKEKKKQVQQHLSQMTLVGKYFASHLLDRYHTDGKPSYLFGLVHYIDKKYDENAYYKYFYITEQVSVRKDGDEFEISKQIMEEGSTNIALFRHEITKEQYDHVIATLIPKIEKVIDEVRHDFKQQDYVSQGDFSNDRSKHNWLDALNVEYIDLETVEFDKGHSNLGIREILTWQHHPYIYNSRLYKVDNWMTIVQNIRDAMYKSASSWGGSILDRDWPRIELLDKFINQFKDGVWQRK